MLEIDPQKACYIMLKARQFDAKVPVQDPDQGSNPSDEDMREVLEDYDDDPVYQELVEAIDVLNEDEQINLVALVWIGRGDFGKEDWQDAVVEARNAHNDHTASYLLGIPMLGDYLEEGLDTLGYSCADYEMGRL